MNNTTKKKIKIKYVGFGIAGKETDNWLSDILSQRYEIELSDDPEWVIDMSSLRNPYAYTQYDCPRILYCGENLTPDFSLIDYGISLDQMAFGDRHFRYPSCIHNHPREWLKPKRCAQRVAERIIDSNDTSILKEKDVFCNFIYGHESENGLRAGFFKELSKKYKSVSSAGMYLNNMPGGRVYSPLDKLKFQERSKFTIAFESIAQRGFCTEKILDAFYAKTIPIYYGDPYVTEIFNPQAFINVSDYRNNDEVIEVIRELDNDDKAYMKMLAAPVFNDPELPQRLYQELCEFIYHIFDQEPTQAFRRSRVYASKEHNDQMRNLHVVTSNKLGKRLYDIMVIYCTGGIQGLCHRLWIKIKNKKFSLKNKNKL